MTVQSIAIYCGFMIRRRYPQPVRTFRPATDRELALAQRLGLPHTDWITDWIDNGFTAEQIADWYPLTRPLTHVADRAVTLRAAGWTHAQVSALASGATLVMPITLISEDVRAIVGNPPALTGWNPDSEPVRDPRTGTEGTRAALVLVQFIYELQEARTRVAAWHRTLLLKYLRAAGAKDTELAAATGLTKQRIGAILDR